MISIHEATKENPYKINVNQPLDLRVACSAGVNRSAVVREYLKTKISSGSIIYPQYGASYGDYENEKIYCASTNALDGFNEIFKCNKHQNVQEIIFSELGYQLAKGFELRSLNDPDREEYKRKIKEYYWTIDKTNKNVFIIVNEDQRVVDLVVKRLTETNQDIDLVVLRLQDTIYFRGNSPIKAQSTEAYALFIDSIDGLFEFF